MLPALTLLTLLAPPGPVAWSGVPALPPNLGAISPDGTQVAAVAGRQVVIARVDTGKTETSPVPGSFAHGSHSLAWPAGGDLSWVLVNAGGFACMARRPTGDVAAPSRPPPPAGDWRLEAARLTPDGKTVLTGWRSADRQKHRVELWPFEAGKWSDELRPLRAVELDPASIAHWQGAGVFSSDSMHYLIVSRQMTAVDLRTGKPAWSVAPPTDVGRFVGLASADGRTVVAVLNPEPDAYELAVWDGPTDRFVRRLPMPKLAGHPNGGRRALTLAITPDGKRVAVLGYAGDGRVTGLVADLATGTEVVNLALQPVDMTTASRLVVSEDGRRLAALGGRTVAVWDLATGADARPPGHRGAITGAVFSKDGRWVVTAGADLVVRCWSAATGEERWRIGVPTEVTLGGLTPDGAGVLLNSKWLGANARRGLARAVRVADGRSLDLPERLNQQAADLVAFSPSGQTVAARTNDGFKLYSWPAGQPTGVIPFAPLAAGDHRHDVVQVRFAADGTELLAVVMHEKPRPPGPLGNPRRVERYDVATGKLLSAVPVAGGHPTLLPAFGRPAYLVAGSGAVADPAGVPVFDVATGERVGLLDRPGLPHWGTVGAVTATPPDNRRLLMAAADGVHVFDPADGSHRGLWPLAQGGVTALGFSRDATRVVTGFWDGVCFVWDAERHLP